MIVEFCRVFYVSFLSGYDIIIRIFAYLRVLAIVWFRIRFCVGFLSLLPFLYTFFPEHIFIMAFDYLSS